MKISEFQQLHNFCTKVYRLPNNSGVMAVYPQFIIKNKNIPETSKIYQIEENGINVIFTMPKKYEKKYEMPPYLFRSFIAMDIVLCSVARGYSNDLFYFYNEELQEVKTKSIMNFLKNKLDQENKEKEKSIIEMFSDILYGVDCMTKSKNSNVEDGYKILSNLMSDGECK